jgi:hypothetical protein
MRGIPSYINMNEKQLEICRSICLNDEVEYTKSNDAEELIINGTLVYNNENNPNKQHTLSFSSPIVRIISTLELFKSNAPSKDLVFSLDNLLINSLQRLRPSILINFLSTNSKNILLERTWQIEFYRVFTSLLGSSGFVDFYIDSNKEWLVEIAREGIKLVEHCQRHEPTGIYGQIKRKAEKIIDFRSSMPDLTKLYPFVGIFKMIQRRKINIMLNLLIILGTLCTRMIIQVRC